MTGEKLRVGILLDSEEIPAWQYFLIQKLLESNCASVRLVLYNAPEITEKCSSSAGKLYRIFERYDRSSWHSDADATKTRRVNDLLGDVDVIRWTTHSASAESADSPAYTQDVKTYQLDVIVALGRPISIETLSRASKYGVWFYKHDYGQTLGDDKSSVGFWEVIKHRPYIRSALMIHQIGTSESVVAYESFSAVHAKSIVRGRNEHLWKILFFVPRALQRLHDIGVASFLKDLCEDPHCGSFESAARKWRLTNFRLMWPVAMYVLWRLWLKLINKIYTDRWVLMFSLTGNSEDFSHFKLILPPSDRFWADPFTVRHDGDSYIFYEDASMASGHGHISVMRMASNGTCSPPTSVLERPYHLSYPFVFEWRGDIFLIPESAENRTIELYRFRVFPNDLDFVRNLMENVEAYDATLVEYSGLWWMFANIRPHAGASSWDELCLFYSDSPISNAWHPHPLNPVVSDVRYARPAGNLFVEDDFLYRPSQNSSHRYGYGLNINRILDMTTETYREEIVTTMEPNWSPSVKAVHTLNRADQLVLIDAIYRSRS